MTDGATPNTVDSQQRPLGLQAVMLVLFITILWSGNPVAVRYSVDTLPPVFVAALRFSLATMLMF